MGLLTDRLGDAGGLRVAITPAGQRQPKGFWNVQLLGPWRPATWTLPLSKCGPLSIRHGRSDADAQPDASTCTVSLYADALGALPKVGDALAVTLGSTAATYLYPLYGQADVAWAGARTRFTGTVTDVTAAPGAAGVTGPGLLTVVAVGASARLGRLTVGDTPWPAETDGARAGRILGLAQAALTATPGAVTVGVVDPGTVTVLPRDVDAQPALELLEELASDAGGVIVARRDGVLEYHDADHRRNVPALVTFTAANVLASARWAQQITGLVNDLSVSWGATDPQATVRVVDPVSVSDYGTLAGTVATRLADATGAGRRAVDAVGRRARPRWRVDGMTVDVLRTLSRGQAGQLAALEVGSLIAVTGFPQSGPFVAARLYVEGWTESWSADGWRLDLDVTEYGLTGPALRWADLPLTELWSTTVDQTWLAAVGWYLGEPAGGRWLDESAGEQWTEVGTVRTWAT